MRFKIEGQSFAKFTLQNNGYDFIFSYPTVIIGKDKINSHFTLHTGREKDRITFKVPSIITDGKESIDIIREMYSKREDYASCVTSKDIDLGGPKFLDYNATNKIVTNLPCIAINLEGHEELPFLAKAKTSDLKFKYVWDLKFPEDKRRNFKLSWAVGRNLDKIAVDKSLFEQMLVVEELNKSGDLYTHLFMVSFDVPLFNKMKETKRAK